MRLSRSILFAMTLAGCGDRPAIPPAARAPQSVAAAAPGTVEFVRAAAARLRAGRELPPERVDPRQADAERAIATQHWRDARTLLEPIVADAPDLAQPRFYLALTHHKERRYSEALPIYEQVLAGTPAFKGAYQTLYFYGWALFYLGRLEVARAAFEATLELNPAKYDAEYGLAQCDVEDGRTADAERRLEGVIRAAAKAADAGDRGAPQDVAKAEARLGDLFEARDDLATARTRYERCVALDPSAYEAWYRLAKVLDRLGDANAATAARAQADRARAAVEQARRSRE